jgi:DNA adenine methylase
MVILSPKTRPLLKTHGGKNYLCRRIVSLFPHHLTFVEPFAGGLSTLLNKPRAKVEVTGDLNADLIHLYETLVADESGAFRQALRRLPYAEATFDQALSDILPVPDHLRLAATYFVRNRMSRGGLGRHFAWSDRLRGGRPGDVNAWMTIGDQLDVIRERLVGVRFCNRDAVAVIQEFDGPETLHYCDPPYLHCTRNAISAYDHEMTDDDHVNLLNVLRACEGCCFLSGSHSPLYDRELAGWRCVEFRMPVHSGQGKAKNYKVECLWIKPARNSAF